MFGYRLYEFVLWLSMYLLKMIELFKLCMLVFAMFQICFTLSFRRFCFHGKKLLFLLLLMLVPFSLCKKTCFFALKPVRKKNPSMWNFSCLVVWKVLCSDTGKISKKFSFISCVHVYLFFVFLWTWCVSEHHSFYAWGRGYSRTIEELYPPSSSSCFV